ncbi:MAG TPA: hypothetical protein VHV82_12515 [Sporichthyaceae bacterium]|nr:hypothetical protein [Sporichthyaceae bacterium]
MPVAHWVFFSDSDHGGWIVDRLHSLDVVGVHLVGGLVGTLLIGLLAGATATGLLTPDHRGVTGLLYGGGLGQLGRQAVAAGVVGAYSFALTWLLGAALDRTMGFRAQADREISGLDLALHSETAYELAPAGASSGRMVGSSE